MDMSVFGFLGFYAALKLWREATLQAFYLSSIFSCALEILFLHLLVANKTIELTVAIVGGPTLLLLAMTLSFIGLRQGSSSGEKSKAN